MDEIAQFLRAHPPFDAIAPDELARLAGAAEVCAFADGETIFAQGAAPQTSVWIVGTGSVELVDHARVLAWTRSLDPAPEVRILPGAEHFFHGRLTELRSILSGWLAARAAENG